MNIILKMPNFIFLMAQGVLIGFALIFPTSYIWGYESMINLIWIFPFIQPFLPKKVGRILFIYAILQIIYWWLDIYYFHFNI
jgi:hypothetical protein